MLAYGLGYSVGETGLRNETSSQTGVDLWFGLVNMVNPVFVAYLPHL